MNLDNLSKRDARLKGLLQQSQQWRRLDAQVKAVLPAWYIKEKEGAQ